jgi:hypothetical protein
MARHGMDEFFIEGEGMVGGDDDGGAVAGPPLGTFKFSRLGPLGTPVPLPIVEKLATAMTEGPAQPNAGIGVPAGFTYLGQFIDHDLTMDVTPVALGTPVPVAGLKQNRSPTLDIDCLYGSGPADPADAKFYQADGVKLKVGATKAVNFGPGTNVDKPGFDLPRTGTGATNADRRKALIPDHRNDENLAVAQIHLAMIRFHNRVVDALAPSTPVNLLFDEARKAVTLHYQWMIRTDYLPRIVDSAIVTDVFTNGRKFFEVSPAQQAAVPTMPIEFSVAAFRLGHSQIRDLYSWNRFFGLAPNLPGGLVQLFEFSGTSGTLSPGGQEPGSDRLPTNWIPDYRRLFLLGAGLAPPAGTRNQAKRIDTLLVDPLKKLPQGSVGAPVPGLEANLAFRNLRRANMVRLASGQQMATRFGIAPLTDTEILQGNGNGADLSDLTSPEQSQLVNRTPLWFYILREAELNGGRLTGVGGRIVVETFHRAMQGSSNSIVRDTTFRPSFGPSRSTFRMSNLIRFAYRNDLAQLNPLG